MNISLEKTVKAIERQIGARPPNLYSAYEQTMRLRSQLLGVIHDQESFGGGLGVSGGEKLAEQLANGAVDNGIVVLTLDEPLPALKEMTASVMEHWVNLMQAAIGKAARAGKLPCFEKAFVWIEIVTPRGTANPKLWDTSNRAVNLVINNLKGVFFRDDNHEHMAFGVEGRWGEKGATIIRVSSYGK